MNETATTARRAAILLLGPTGAGKTPLGQAIEERGWAGHACLHFDFGAALREVVARGQPHTQISAEDLVFLNRVLREGLLLENEQFPLARKILESFLAARRAGSETWLVLNGLPRHVGQAQALASVVDVRVVIVLRCTPDVVYQRIRGNTGGDRAGRADDAPEAIAAKLRLFESRTTPLVEHYRAAGSSIRQIEVTVTVTADEAYQLCVEASSGPDSC